MKGIEEQMKKSIQSNLFLSYFKFMVLLILGFAILFYVFFSESLKENASNALLAECDNLSTQLDTHLMRMNNLSKHIVVSKPLKSLFYGDLYQYSQQSAKNRQDFSDMLFGAMDYSAENLAINMFDFEGRYINISNTSIYKMIAPEISADLAWTEPVIHAKGNKVLLPAHQNDWNVKDKPVISLCRSFSLTNTLPHSSVVEIQMPASVVENTIKQTLLNKTDTYALYILDETGKMIYPFEEEIHAAMGETVEKYWKLMQENEKHYGVLKGETQDHETTYFGYKTSDDFGWTILTVTPKKELLKPSIQFRNIILLSLVLVLLITLFISYQIAKGLVVPLERLRSIITRLDLRNLSKESIPDYSSRYDELNQLYGSFQSMNHKLTDSLDEVVSLRSHEIQARMLALQSQMNPHFLYNTISIISILAEDGSTEEIIRVCDDLSSMLRYISSNSTSPVKMELEIAQTTAYINLMKIKFEERLVFCIDIPEEMYSLQIPKLVIQPLVENCIKYAADTTPPWIIRVEGRIEEDRWYVKVRDNGSGFGEEKRKDMLHMLETIVPEKASPELQIDGMGLINLYVRLKLAYGEAAIFQIENLPEGGAEVTIGGREGGMNHEA